MADTDSFINEVTEEVRRDRLYALFRRWWWAAALVVVLIVGGAAYFEWQRSQERQSAEALGDAIIAALDAPAAASRIDALDAITPDGADAEILLALIAAAEAASLDDPSRAAARLRAAAEAPDLPRRYRDLAVLKAELLAPSPPEEARLLLGRLAEPGAPYAALAEEQLALLDIAEGDPEAGLERLRALETAAAATPALQQRAAQLIIAFEAGAELVDTAPEAAPAPDDLPAPAPDLAVPEPALPQGELETAEPGADDRAVPSETESDGSPAFPTGAPVDAAPVEGTPATSDEGATAGAEATIAPEADAEPIAGDDAAAETD